MTRSFAPVLMVLLLSMGATLSAQVDPTSPKISVSDLQSKVAKITEIDELEKLAQTWKATVASEAEDKLERLAAERKSASGDAKTKITEEIEELRKLRSALVDKMQVVVSALKSKDAAKAKPFEDYLSGLGTFLDPTDPNSLLIFVTTWLKSPEGGIKWGLKILLFIVILIAAKILANIVGRVINSGLRASKVKTSDLLRAFFVNTATKVVFFIGLVLALGQVGIDIGPLLAGIGVFGFVVGFALQGTLSNFASGVMILLYRPYDIRDVIEAAGVKGTVDAMTLVATTLVTPDNQTVVIPNSSIWGGVITNVTGRTNRRVDLMFGIGYGDDIALAERTLMEILTSHEKVLKDPAPVVKLHQLADSSVNFVVRPWSKTSDYWDVYWDVTRAVKERFDAAGLSIPFPQRDVHLHQASE